MRRICHAQGCHVNYLESIVAGRLPATFREQLGRLGGWEVLRFSRVWPWGLGGSRELGRRESCEATFRIKGWSGVLWALQPWGARRMVASEYEIPACVCLAPRPMSSRDSLLSESRK